MMMMMMLKSCSHYRLVQLVRRPTTKYSLSVQIKVHAFILIQID